MSDPPDILDSSANWEERLALVVETMKEMSRQTDPDTMVALYSARAQTTGPRRILSLSRRGVEPPRYVLARDSDWENQPNPWRERGELPVLEGGLLGELVYGNEPRVIQDLQVGDGDASAELLAGARSLLAMPVYDGGESLNMVIVLASEPDGIDTATVPPQIWMANLFGRATHNLVLSAEVKRAYETVDREMKVIADIQRSLLPSRLPSIPTLDLAVHYQPATRAGGDYYDFFPFDDGTWGILISDVSGHGSPAAVEMAIARTLMHLKAQDPVSPGAMLEFVNRHLVTRIGSGPSSFVTAFFGVYDPKAYVIKYAIAGHPPPRLKRCSDGSLFSFRGTTGPPLGVVRGRGYEEMTQELRPGDQIVFFTDGITEAFNCDREMFGIERLDATLENCSVTAEGLIAEVLESLFGFTCGGELTDDLTLVVARVTPRAP